MAIVKGFFLRFSLVERERERREREREREEREREREKERERGREREREKERKRESEWADEGNTRMKLEGHVQEESVQHCTIPKGN